MLFITLILNSCKIQTKEFLKFESSNSAIIGGNKTNIKLIPKNSKIKNSVNVEIFSKNEYWDNRKITIERYNHILNLYNKLSEKDTAKTVSIDAPTLKVNYTKDNYNKEFYFEGIPKKGETFYDIIILILESAKLKITDIH